MSVQLTKPLVVPEYTSALVKMYVADPDTSATVCLTPYTINVQDLLTSLIPGRTAAANACALNGDDLFIANSSIDSQCIFKVPQYLIKRGAAATEAFVFTLDGNDYVGMAFDAAGNLYAAEGNNLNNHVFRYTGTGKMFPGGVAAASSNYATRLDLGNAGSISYFANLSFDATGNLWVSDYKNHRLVVFDAANLGGTNTYHVLANCTSSIPVANTNPTLMKNTKHLFAQPEGIDFDSTGNLWVSNNNDGSGGFRNPRTSIIQITRALQAAVLATPEGGTLIPRAAQSNREFFIYQVPNLADDHGALPQFGGLQVDRAADRIFVNEEVAGNGRWYDIVNVAAIGTATANNDLDIVSTNPGNGGIVLVDARIDPSP
jgi:sugar lactone lactonase YvrE